MKDLSISETFSSLWNESWFLCVCGEEESPKIKHFLWYNLLPIQMNIKVCFFYGIWLKKYVSNKEVCLGYVWKLNILRFKFTTEYMFYSFKIEDDKITNDNTQIEVQI